MHGGLELLTLAFFVVFLLLMIIIHYILSLDFYSTSPFFPPRSFLVSVYCKARYMMDGRISLFWYGFDVD